jgi:hypothetical protein
MLEGLARLREEAECPHVVTVRDGKPYASVVADHAGERRTFLHESLSKQEQARALRRALLEWLLALHAGGG